MDLGERLFELRKAKNLTQDDVAEKLNVTRQTVSKWETNQSTPDFDKIVPLCELYEISPNELLTGEKQEQETVDNKNSDEFNWNEAKKHLFARGKDDEDNYENMTKNILYCNSFCRNRNNCDDVESSCSRMYFLNTNWMGSNKNCKTLYVSSKI